MVFAPDDGIMVVGGKNVWCGAGKTQSIMDKNNEGQI